MYGFTDINLEGVAFLVRIHMSIWKQTIREERKKDEFRERQELVSR